MIPCDGSSSIRRRGRVNNDRPIASICCSHASGWVRVYLRETSIALEHVARAIRLSPLDPLMFSMHQVTSSAHFIAGHYAEAVRWAEKAFREQPNSLATIRLLD